MLLAIAPVIGLGRITGALPGVATAFEYDIEAALDEPDGPLSVRSPVTNIWGMRSANPNSDDRRVTADHTFTHNRWENGAAPMTDQTLATDYSSLVAGQRAYFKAGHTRPVEWRIEQLKAIKSDDRREPRRDV